MHYLATILHLSMLAASHASPTKPPLRARGQNHIQWDKPCSRELNTTLIPIPSGVLCGSLRVPLDYTDESSDATLDLELIKLPASKTPVKGSILLNFGGPGPNNRAAFSLLSEQLRSYVPAIDVHENHPPNLARLDLLEAFITSFILSQGRCSFDDHSRLHDG